MRIIKEFVTNLATVLSYILFFTGTAVAMLAAMLALIALILAPPRLLSAGHAIEGIGCFLLLVVIIAAIKTLMER